VTTPKRSRDCRGLGHPPPRRSGRCRARRRGPGGRGRTHAKVLVVARRHEQQ
jgi:hypothetical protein